MAQRQHRLGTCSQDKIVTRSSIESSGSTCSSEHKATNASDCSRCRGRSPTCFRCNGEVWITCGRCQGSGELKTTRQCWCSGQRQSCRKCQGSGETTLVRECRSCGGAGLWQCTHCKGRGVFPCAGCGRGMCAATRGSRQIDLSTEPAPGVTITRCCGTEVSQISKLWSDRGGCQRVLGVWEVSNPLLNHRYRLRRSELEKQLGRPPAELRGLHGSSPGNILSIAEQGFDSGRRAGQAFGAGEYFAKDPSVSVSYCRGGSFMLVCQLCLGSEDNGDHIWVPSAQYYVISGPAQVLPLYVVHFQGSGAPLPDDQTLAKALSGEVYRSGSSKDDRLISLDTSSSGSGSGGLRIEALPAAWWSGDIDAFRGPLFFDLENSNGASPMDRPSVRGAVAVVHRGGGKFAATAARAQQAGARAILVVQSSAEAPLTVMQGVAGLECSLPAAMIRQEPGLALIAMLQQAGKVQIELALRCGGDSGVPPNRPCAMSAARTDALWMGFLHSHFSDQQLAADVLRFLEAHAPPMPGPEVRIVRGKFTQAKVALRVPLTREMVLALNSKPFFECSTERALTVDDAHGSPEQQCPRMISGYCRGQNLRFEDPCWCRHNKLPTEGAIYSMTTVDLVSAKGDEICSGFLRSAPFHNGLPAVLSVRAIHNARLERQHELYRRYLTQKHGKAPQHIDLYHGTNVNILDTVYTHGLFPPSDMEASDDCPVSGGKGLRTSLCSNGCEFCTQRHAWNRCHMFGLGIYLGDIAQKSHRYVSGVGEGDEYKMVICSVLLGEALQVEGHLKCKEAMHGMQSLRAIGHDGLEGMVESIGASPLSTGAEQKDILFVKGLKGSCRPGFSVFNSEYIAFHPYQCLPLYEITYRL